jgi:toxin-antitoxin system PIN domain toxin
MKSCLVDINVLVALLAGRHKHHSIARKWFAECSRGEIGLCRYVQLGVIRLLATPAVMGGSALSTFGAFRILHELIDFDERVEFAAESGSVDSVLPGLLSQASPAGKIVNDAYLAAFAIAANRRLVTFDADFRRFKDLDLSLLTDANHA